MKDKIYKVIKNNLFKTEGEFKKGVAKDLNISPEDVFDYYDNVTVFTIRYKDTFYDCKIDSNQVICIKI